MAADNLAFNSNTDPLTAFSNPTLILISLVVFLMSPMIVSWSRRSRSLYYYRLTLEYVQAKIMGYAVGDNPGFYFPSSYIRKLGDEITEVESEKRGILAMVSNLITYRPFFTALWIANDFVLGFTFFSVFIIDGFDNPNLIHFPLWVFAALAIFILHLRSLWPGYIFNARNSEWGASYSKTAGNAGFALLIIEFILLFLLFALFVIMVGLNSLTIAPFNLGVFGTYLSTGNTLFFIGAILGFLFCLGSLFAMICIVIRYWNATHTGEDRIRDYFTFSRAGLMNIWRTDDEKHGKRN